MPNTVYAEDVNYFQTSNKAADTWIDDAIDEIKAIGGSVSGYAFGVENGRSAFMMEFVISAERFKIIWPVLPTRAKGKDRAAKVQAATALYHDVKAKCVAVKFIGLRAAFLPYLSLPDGRIASQLATDDLTRLVPALLLPSVTN